MKTMALVLIVAGLIQMAVAGSMKVSLPAYPDMANIDLIAQRGLVFFGGGFAFVAGVVAMAGHHVAKAIRERRPDA